MTRRNIWLATAMLLLFPSLAFADDAVSPAMFTANNAWMMLCAGLVFVMHLGFACLESGLTRAKNTVNILFKNTFIICIGLLTYFVCGFNLMYPGDSALSLMAANEALLAAGEAAVPVPADACQPDADRSGGRRSSSATALRAASRLRTAPAQPPR